jgi:hypothetical protein
MSKRHKVGKNDLCPCGSLLKYKKCCRGNVDWEQTLTQPLAASVPHLSTRGRNLLFLDLVADALQLNSITDSSNWPEFKRAFTPDAVRKIHEAVQFVWPTQEQVIRTLRRERPRMSGLYTGLYDPAAFLRGVTRHSLYTDRILLIDPVMHPDKVKPEYNPLLHPDMYRSTALRWIAMWFSLAPWIEAGVVGFVRSLGDLDTGLELQSYKAVEARFKDDPELHRLQDEAATELSGAYLESYERQMMLGIPDDAIRRKAKELNPELTPEQIECIIQHIQARRDQDPYFIEPLDVEGKRSELLHLSTGANYELTKLTALQAGSFIVTDLDVRWREMQVDRNRQGLDREAWSPFARAFQAVSMNYLNNVPLPAALHVRQEGKLESMRSFFRRVWKESSSPDEEAESNAANLAAELQEKVREAEAEWRAIDRELLRWFGSEFAAGALALGPAIALGGGEWAAAAVAIAGAANLMVARKKREELELKYPAGMLFKLREGKFRP